MARVRTYVKHVQISYDKFKDIDSLLDTAILKETETGAIFKAITSFVEEGMATFVIVFERTSA